MKNLFKTSIIALSVLSFGTALAKENIGQKKTIEKKTRAGCAQTSADIDLDINNVRAYLMNGGDMWWNRAQGAAAYTVPKAGKANALFAGSIWVGGKDVSSGNLVKVAAQTYRQGGNDYWSGPLDMQGQITPTECILWDKMWKIDASAIAKFRKIYAGIDKDSTQKIKDIIAVNAGDVDKVIQEWPGRNSTTARGSGNLPITLTPNKAFAPFVDLNKDGKYSWTEGDYPAISGDQYIWWIFNDRGNLKTETGSQSIGLEIAGSAFAFSTQDELNDATFYNFNILNRGTSTLAETYMATWTDADLGYAFDDYVGCDTKRDLGIIYNGDDFDEGPTGYGTDIPMLGVDFFKGPKGKKADGTDTTLGMSYFMFFNNNSGGDGNPSTVAHFYNYLTGTFKDNVKLTKTCNGRDAGEITSFAFPNSYKECSPCNNLPYDRRFIHSSGPFDLLPGVSNDITIGAMFIPSVGGNCPGFGKLQAVDDKAQKLFDEEFKLPFGPQAPDVVIKPFNQKFVFYLNNPYGSNNFNLSYGNKDSGSVYLEKSVDASKQGSKDSLYKFEGYIVYQLKNDKISTSQLRKKDGTIDETKARIVYQCDIKNDITTLFNHENDPEIPNNEYFTPKLMVAGGDKGISNNFQITTDAFGSGSNKNLVNYKTYNYLVVAYAKNTFKTFSGGKNPSGQSHEYSESRTNGRGEPVAVFSVSPHPVYDNLYTATNASFGDGIEIMQVEGKGNGGSVMDLTDETVNTILNAPYFTQTPVYKPGAGPVKLKITDADSLKPGNYTIKLKVDSMYSYIPGTFGVPYRDSTKGARGAYTKWSIERENEGVTETIYSENNIATYNEQILARWGQGGEGVKSDWGFSMGAEQVLRPSDQSKDDRFLNGYITKGSTIEFADPSNPWLDGIKDEDGNSPNNWIRSGLKYGTGGINAEGNTFGGGDMDDYLDNPDSSGNFERIIGGTWAPYNLAARGQINSSILENIGLEMLYYKSSLDRPGAANARVLMSQVHSVDIVFTSDRSKWTKCNVVEMNYGDTLPVLASYIPAYSEGKAYRFNLRNHFSLEREPNADGSPKYSTLDSGRSWFPGYAVNIETGERLNMMFGEDSGDRLNNGSDMIWNPTDDIIDFQKQDLHWGGHHVVYISNTRYDEGNFIHSKLSQFPASDPATGSAEQIEKSNIYKSMMWVSPAILSKGRKLASWKDGIVPTTCKVRLRVTRPYAKYGNDAAAFTNNGWPVYKFNTSKVVPSKLTDKTNPYNNDSKALLANITCVPNPYYAYSEYENNRLTNKMKIINLPQTASINIYSTDGSLVKTILKSDASTTFVDWDMKNNKGVPIASGMYLIHVKIKTDQGDKETVLKWFGIMRSLDITSF
jgi:hypothetical protein